MEWLLIAAPLVWLAVVIGQQTRRWLATRRPADWEEGERRAQLLLRETLTVEEQAALAERGYLDLPSRQYPQRYYRVYRQPRLVEVYDRGRRSQALCIQPTSYLPPSDRLLLHKLLLEADEARYLRLANVSRYGRLEFPPRVVPANPAPTVRVIE